MNSARDPAAARLAILQTLRLSGAVLVVLGMLTIARRAEWLAGVPVVAGYLMAGIGLAEFFVVPLVLARRWRSPK